MFRHTVRLAVLVTLITASSHAGFASAKTNVAPADEYFGHLKMSILGIGNTIKDTTIRVSSDPDHAARYYGGLNWAEEALEDWARKYPQDNWIPQRAYDMSHVFWRMRTAEADSAAKRCRDLLFIRFPRSKFALRAGGETPQAFITASTVTTASGGQ